MFGRYAHNISAYRLFRNVILVHGGVAITERAICLLDARGGRACLLQEWCQHSIKKHAQTRASSALRCKLAS